MLNPKRYYMKKIAIVFVCVMLLSSCHQSKPEKVESLVDAKNSYDKEIFDKFLSDDFYFYGIDDTLSKQEYLALLDSLKSSESIPCSSTILQIQDLDSIIKTKEESRTIIDSYLKVTPSIVKMKTYRFVDDKVSSITIDSILNYEEYVESYNEKITPFIYYVKEKYGIEDQQEIISDLEKYLSEYVNLSTSEKKQYKNYSYLQGTYFSKDCAFYKKLIFKGRKTVTIIDAIFGFSFTSSYELDENLVRIKTDKSDLLFEIKDSRTLIGEGFAEGTFNKID